MKTVLIPTDFSEKSLQLIKNAVLHYPNESINIVLATGYNMSFFNHSFSNFSKSKIISSLANKDFNKTLSNLIEEHKNKISNVTIELYTGRTSRDFKDFLTAHTIDESIIPNTNLYQFSTKKYFDITDLIQSNSPKVSSVSYQGKDQNKSTGFWFLNLREQFSF